MTPDPKREPGFYWVRFAGEKAVAKHDRWGSEGFWRWLIPGSEEDFMDVDIAEVLSPRLEPPQEAR